MNATSLSATDKAAPTVTAPTDRRLLDRFAAGEAAAFAELMERHGRMVIAVCRRVLRREADAEDAFQATFLALIQQRGGLPPAMSIGGWLHTVATRVALRLRRQRASAEHRERESAAMRMSLQPKSGSSVSWEEALDEAIAGLPDEHRLPLTLCDLLGRTGDEAAAELGCSRSTVTRRLTEAREALRRRLERMGFVVPAAALALWLDQTACAAAIPAGATTALLKVAAGASPASAGISPAVVKLAGGATTGVTGVALKVAVAMTAVALLAVIAWSGIAMNVGDSVEPAGASAESAVPGTTGPAASSRAKFQHHVAQHPMAESCIPESWGR